MEGKLTEEAVSEFKDAFELFQEDGPSAKPVDEAELRLIFTELDLPIDEPLIKTLIKEVNKDGRGAIDFPSFLLTLQEKFVEVEPKVEVVEAFKIFDQEDTGKVDLKDMRDALTTLGAAPLSSEEADDFFSLIAPDDAGKLDYDLLARALKCDGQLPSSPSSESLGLPLLEIPKSPSMDQSTPSNMPTTPTGGSQLKLVSKPCQKCGLITETRCARCRRVWYCKSKCQHDDWPTHKPSCRKPGTRPKGA